MGRMWGEGNGVVFEKDGWLLHRARRAEGALFERVGNAYSLAVYMAPGTGFALPGRAQRSNSAPPHIW